MIGRVQMTVLFKVSSVPRSAVFKVTSVHGQQCSRSAVFKVRSVHG